MLKSRYFKILWLSLYLVFISAVSIEFSLRFYGFLYNLPRKIQNNKETLGISKKTYTILLLGESTTALATWPVQLETLLNNNSQGVTFKVINEGLPGTASAFIVGRLEDNLKKYQPDVVVTMMGINDGMSYLRYDPKLGSSLRIVKLFRTLKFSIKNGHLFNFEPKNTLFMVDRNVSKEIADKTNRLQEEAMEYVRQNNFDLAELTLKQILDADPENEQAYRHLGLLYLNADNLDESEKMFKNSIRLSNKYKTANYDNSDNGIALLAIVYKKKGMSDSEIIANISAISGETQRVLGLFTGENPDENTTFNYRKLHEVLAKNNIRHVAVQYPTLSVQALRDTLNNNENVIYVSNEENFRKALEKYNYDDLFTDRFAGTFGHTTGLGDSLIAENLAITILENLDF